MSSECPEFYPWGPSAGDFQLGSYIYWWSYTSALISIEGGAPFGAERFDEIYVSTIYGSIIIKEVLFPEVICYICQIPVFWCNVKVRLPIFVFPNFGLSGCRVLTIHNCTPRTSILALVKSYILCSNRSQRRLLSYFLLSVTANSVWGYSQSHSIFNSYNHRGFHFSAYNL